MKRFLVSGEQLCRTFTSSALVLETNSTMPTVDIDTERQIIDLKRKINDVRNELLCNNIITGEMRCAQNQDNKGHKLQIEPTVIVV